MRIHLDHNATTPLRAEVRALLHALIDEDLGNPSSLHARGRRARHLVDEARERVAGALGVLEDEVWFTGGGTESIGLALQGALCALGPQAGLVTTAIEHSAVLGTASAVGRPWRAIPVDPMGRLRLDALEEALDEPWARLASVQAANNEIGVVQPLQRVIALARARGAVVHADLVQALGRIALPLGPDGADLASLSAHKVGGPQGVGVLVRRRGVPLLPRAYGGEQEGGWRPGTENVAGIAAAALAIELAAAEREDYAARVGAHARALWTELAERMPEARLLGPEIDAPDRLPNTLCVALGDVDGKVLVTRLDLEGLEVSAGSACASGSLEPSHVLLALGCDERVARAAVRLSLGRDTTRDACRRAVDILLKVSRASRAT